MPTPIQRQAPAAKGKRAPAEFVPASVARLSLRTRGGVRVVRAAEIVLVASCENYTEVRLHGGERLLVRRTMKAWLALLPGARFARVHRQAIVNLDYLRGWQRLNKHVSLLTLDGCRQPVRAQWRALCDVRAKLTRAEEPAG